MADALRYGIIGSGMMGIEHLLNLAHVDGAEVTAIADPHQGSREWPDWRRRRAPRSRRSSTTTSCLRPGCATRS